MLPMIFGALAPSLFTSMAPWMAAAIGSGLGSMIQGGSTEDVLKSAAMGGLGAGIGSGFSGGSSAVGGVNPADPNSLAGIDAAGTLNYTPIPKNYTPIPAKGIGQINTNSVGGNAVMPPQAGGMFDINPDFNVMGALTSPAGIAAGLGASMYTPKYKEEEEEEVEYPRGEPIKNTSIFPEYGYDAGKDGEFDYNIGKNYANGGLLKYVEGGEIVDPMQMKQSLEALKESGVEEALMQMQQDPKALEMGLGAIEQAAKLEGQSDESQEGEMNDKELISGAIDVIQGEIENPEQQKLILGKFVAQFGQEALQDLVQKVQSGDIPNEPSPAEGKIEGAGDGMQDMVPASLGKEQDVLLSDGEFVVPADVVSGIGNGSTDAGSGKLEEMMNRVREMRTGGTTQPPQIPQEMLLPA
tara:strand:- start:140 stop:1372 length:1233 start_codon:yes stop_codon:yes gene_type:complete